MNPENPSPRRSAAVTGLAIAGFIALIVLGIWLAIYSARLVPSAIGGLGSAATYIGSLFTPAEDPGLAVVPPTPGITTPPAAPTTTPPSTPSAPTKPAPTPSTRPVVTPTPGPERNVTYGTPRSAPYGLPDFAVTIIGVGYATNTNFSGFVASPAISKSQMGSVKFRVANVGTNVSGPWNFTVTVPTNPYTVRSFPGQASLNPGDSVEFVLSFTELMTGTQTISVNADSDHRIGESNETNNAATAQLTILGS